MRRQLTFADFRRDYMDCPGGYFPVHAALVEDDEGRPLKVVWLDLVCEWRLPDGKVRFLAVPFETRQELSHVLAYLELKASLLHKTLRQNIQALSHDAGRVL